MNTSAWMGLLWAGLGLTVWAAGAEAGAAELKVGDKAPDFNMMGSDGKRHELADYQGKQAVILAWFPKASTPGCTAQCTSYAKAGSPLKAMDVVYFTASVDAPEANAKFAKEVHADYPILSDPDKDTAEAYGVLNAKGMANRWTFYIDKEGIVRAIDKKIETKQAAEDTLARVKELGFGSK